MRRVENNLRLNLFRQRDKYYRMDLGIYLLASRVKKKKKKETRKIRLKILASSRYNFYDTRSPSIERKIYPLRNILPRKKKKKKRRKVEQAKRSPRFERKPKEESENRRTDKTL